MPVYNFTVDDSSPMIIYSQGWVDNSSDPQLSGYFDRTSHATNLKGATASVTFFGDAVHLYGGTRSNYGPFNVTLDDQTTSHDVTTAANTVQNVLFAATGLSRNTHTLILTNAGSGTFVDIDFITFTTGDGDSSGPMYSNIDDSSPLITYSPSASWQTTSPSPPSYFNSTLHSSKLQGAQATVPFNGNSVAVYGATDPSHGIFTVKIDDQPTVSLNGSAPVFRPRTLLYWASGLQNGNHSVTITNTQNLSLVDLDSVGVTSWGSAPTSANQPSNSRTAMIVGVVSGACVLFACIATLVLILRGRRMRRRQGHFEETKLHRLSLRPDSASHDFRKFSYESEADALPTCPQSTASPRSGTGSTSDGSPIDAQRRTASALSRPNRHSSTLSSIRSASTSGSQPPSGPSRRERMSFGKLLLTTRVSPRKLVVSNRLNDLGNIQSDDDDTDSSSDEGPPDYTETTQPMPRQPTPVQLL